MMKQHRLERGVFITVEGPEGCGKSTQVPYMVTWLKKHGYRVRSLREPGGTVLGEQIREILLSSKHRHMNAQTELFLFLAARAQLVEEIIMPALKEGEVVISDRFFDSTVVYQGMAGGLGRDFVERLCAWGTQGLRPDLTFFLDVDYREGLRRAGRKDRMEQKSLAFHRRVAESYRRVAKRHVRRAVVIDGRNNIAVVRRKIEEELQRFFAR